MVSPQFGQGSLTSAVTEQIAQHKEWDNQSGRQQQRIPKINPMLVPCPTVRLMIKPAMKRINPTATLNENRKRCQKCGARLVI